MKDLSMAINLRRELSHALNVGIIEREPFESPWDAVRRWMREEGYGYLVRRIWHGLRRDLEACMLHSTQHALLMSMQKMRCPTCMARGE